MYSCIFFFSFHGGEVFRLSTPGSHAPPFRSHSGPPQNYPRDGYPSHPRSNQSTPLSSRDYSDPRRNNYDRYQAPRGNTRGYQGNRPTAWSHTLPSFRGPGSSQPQFSRVITTTSHVTRGNIRTLFGLHMYRASYCPLDLL